MIMSAFTDPVLNEPLCKLGFSPQFLVVSELAGFYTLSDMLSQQTCYLLRLPGFNYHVLSELVHFLEERQLGHYIDPA